MKKFRLIIALFLLISNFAQAQILKDPTIWTYEVKKTGEGKYNLIFHLKMPEHFHIYALNPGGDGTLIAPKFDVKSNPQIKLVGKIKQIGKVIDEDIDGVGLIHYLLTKVDYIQQIEVKFNTTITGTHLYQVCNESECIKPKTKPFSFEIKDAGTNSIDSNIQKQTETSNQSNNTDTTKATNSGTTPKSNNTPKADTKKTPKSQNSEVPKSMWIIFLSGLGAGLAAVVTPCIYSMIPITVSFFTKKSKNRRQGIINASFYSISIVFIFAALGMLIVGAFGANALNSLSTHWIPNLIFFAIFILFAFSFLGAFELTLPSSWTNKVDSKANTNSFTGIFFMALTLVIVSFSCTSAFIGGIAVLASKGGLWGPLVGFGSFGLGIALPFTIFALFPSYLKNLEKPGGWQNAVKVTLGFLELALAMKFLSNADLKMGWGLLDREVFIAIWVVLAILLGMYLLGKLRFSHDDDLPKNMFGVPFVSIPRLLLAISAFSFAAYMIPGMWGAPLKAISSFVPPMGTQDFVGLTTSDNISAPVNSSDLHPVKFVDKFKKFEPNVVKSNGLVTYFDIEEAKAAAQKLKKPLMLDFTGIVCVNCREMESRVWSDPEVTKRLKEDFVIVSLYCDYDAEKLPENEQYESKILGSKITSIGDKNEDYQAVRFGTNAMPIYYFLDENDNQLSPTGYKHNLNVSDFIAHLDAVKAKYKELNP